MGITIKDIAKIAGVSHSTVSRSLNDNPLISKATRERIQKIAEELDFEVNANARSLNTKKTDTIGLIYPETMNESKVNLYHSSLLNELRSVLEKEEFDTIVTFPKNRFTNNSNIKKLINRKKVDGLIIVTADISDEDMEYIVKKKLPFVFIHYTPKFKKKYKIDLITTDHFIGGKIATQYLIDLGHKEILCLTNSGNEVEFIERTEGYKAALEENGIFFNKNYLLKKDFSFEAGYQLIDKNKDLLNKITAIFAQNDLLALGAIKAITEEGLSVPDDISVIGYDNSELGEYFIPSLTTIHQPREEIAKLACKQLIDLINEKRESKIKKTYIKPKIIIRDSCKKIKHND